MVSGLLVPASAEILSISMEASALVYLRNGQLKVALILIAIHVTTDLLVVGCLPPMLFVSLSAASPVVSFIIARERFTVLKMFGVALIVAGVIWLGSVLDKSSDMCCTMPADFVAVLASGSVCAALLASRYFQSTKESYSLVYRIFLMISISAISLLNLVCMEMVTRCGHYSYVVVVLVLTALEMYCAKASVTLSALTTHVPVWYAFYQLGGAAVTNFLFKRQLVLPMVGPIVCILFGVLTVVFEYGPKKRHRK